MNFAAPVPISHANMAAKVIISYAHEDARVLERLHKHLAVLRREGKISEWFDRQILVGVKLDQEISANLDDADIFLAIVSPDFLASNYCYEREMARAIERHEAGKMRIVPIIAEPCEWLQTPLKQFKAAPRDGKPISDWTNPNTAYLDIAGELRRLVEAMEEGARPSAQKRESAATSRKYRVKKEFDEIDKSEFRDRAFETMSKYFEDAAQEMNSIEGVKARYRRLSPDAFSATIVNRNQNNETAHVTVRRGGGSRSWTGGAITYSWQEGSDNNSYNGTFSVESDEYQLFLKSGDFRGENEILTEKTAAEKLWVEFIEKVGIEYD